MATTNQLLAFAALFGTTPRTRPIDKPVKTVLANECLKNFHDLLSNPAANAQAIKDAYTDCADFGSDGLINWASKIKKTSNVNCIKVRFGVYSNNIPGVPAEHVGRITVFLYPFYEVYDQVTDHVISSDQARYNNLVDPADGNDGEPVDPFNFAGIEP